MQTNNPQSQIYHLSEKVMTDGEIPVSLYVNQVTGLKIVTAYTECPIVKGDIVFATEAFDDDGLPHTLEHLVFLGSEDYPYKGVLDLLANRCLSDGTNAYTDTDHTNYTLSTAGTEGFLNLLPIYLDHLLFPTLTDTAYTTEVHHINGDGEDGGVVYCEMQARENTGESRCYEEMLKYMYPGKCGYKSCTGGRMANLRESTNNTKVRAYHKQYYHAKNLCVVVTGPIEPEEVFAAIKHIEDKIVAKGMHKLEFERPWQSPVEPLDSSQSVTLKYASDTDDDGLVNVGYRGPNVVDNFKELVAISVLLDYLDSTAISPIQRDFVECDEPYCSSVSHSIIENSTATFYLSFESVGKQYLSLVATKLHELLGRILKKEEEFDMERLKTIISRKVVQILSTAESSPHSLVVGPVIGHFLYGTTNLSQRCQEIPILEEFAKCETDFWLSLIDKYFVGPEARHVCIVGDPSPSVMESQSEAEKNRLECQKAKLKEELPMIGEKLKSAIESNEKPAPLSMLTSIKVPSPECIKFHQIERVVLDKTMTPFRFQYDSIKTNFVTIHLLMNTSKCLTRQDRLYLPLMTELILETPIERDGIVLPYEKVVAELFADTITYQASIGISSGSPYSTGLIGMLFDIVMQVELNKYEKAVKWYSEILYKTIFTAERIKTVATKMVSDISQYKRSGGKITGATANGLAYQSNSNQWATNFIRQRRFLKQVLKNLSKEPKTIQEQLTRIRDCLASPGNMLVHLSLNKEKIDVKKVHEPWLKLLPKGVLDGEISEHFQPDDIVPCHKLVEPYDGSTSAIVSLGTVESNYMYHLVKSISDFKHPDLPALYVLIQYLTQIEGPLWRQLRGAGLTYNYSIDAAPSDGLLYLTLAKATHLVTAYEKAAEIVQRHLKGEEEFEDSLFESAKSSLVFLFIRREKSAAGKSMQSLVAHLRNLDIDFNKELIRRVVNVSKEELREVGELYLKPLFQSGDTLTAVCCNPTKVDEVIEGFDALDLHLKQINIDEDKFINSLD